MAWLRPLASRSRASPIKEWFRVTWSDVDVHLSAQPPGKAAWTSSFRWSEVIRVCFKAEDMLVSDGIYVFTSARQESYVIPIEADGGDALWAEILRRGLFDAELAIEAVRSTGGVYCWPRGEQGS